MEGVFDKNRGVGGKVGKEWAQSRSGNAPYPSVHSDNSTTNTILCQLLLSKTLRTGKWRASILGNTLKEWDR